MKNTYICSDTTAFVVVPIIIIVLFVSVGIYNGITTTNKRVVSEEEYCFYQGYKKTSNLPANCLKYYTNK